MFTQEPQLCTTWDVHWSVQPNTCIIDQGVCDALVAPTTYQNDGNLNFCICRYIKLWWYQVLDETSMELSKHGELFKGILQSVILVILTARFEDATPSECKIICMWIDRLHDKVTWVMFNRHREPRLKLEHSPVYPGMTAGVCCTALSSSFVAVPLSFEQEDE